MNNRYGGISKFYICPQCGALFGVPFQSRGGGKTHWAYKRKRQGKAIYLCSYHCLQTIREQETHEEIHIYDGSDT